MPKQDNELSFKGQKIYTGIDVHLKQWTVSIMQEHCIHKTFSMNPSANDLKNYLKKHFPGGEYLSAYEASFCGFGAHYELNRHGISNIVVNPADIPTTDKERKQKEDSRDSRKIARCLREGSLTAIYVPTVQEQELRGMVRYRKTLVKEITRTKNRIKSYLYMNGVKFLPENEAASKYWSGRFTQWLSGLSFATSEGKVVLDGYLKTANFLRGELLGMNRKFREMAKSGNHADRLRLLCSIPGIGLTTALTFLSEIGDFKRFGNLDHFSSYVGLVPKTDSSGETIKETSINPRANRQLRNILVEAAWVAIRQDSALGLAFNKLCTRMPKNKAIIRIAKKLLNRIRYVMKNEKTYEYGKI